MKTMLLVTAAFALSVTSTVNAQGMNMPMKPAASQSGSTLPLVDAEVRKIDLERGLVVLRHGDIPNIGMTAMTMGFDVADMKMLDGLKVGDKVRFQAAMVKGKATVTELKPMR